MALEFKQLEKILKKEGFLQIISNTGSHLKYLLATDYEYINLQFPHRESDNREREKRAVMIDHHAIMVMRQKGNYKTKTGQDILKTIAYKTHKSLDELLQDYNIHI